MVFPGVNNEIPAIATIPGSCARSQIIATLKKLRAIDLCIIGPGALAACVAHYAAFQGLRVVLVSSGDYFSERDLPLGGGSFEASEVLTIPSPTISLRGIKKFRSRIINLCSLLQKAPHLITLYKVEDKIGEKTHSRSIQQDLFGKILLSLLRWPKEVQAILPACMRLDLERFAFESVLAARQEGATALNYLRVERVSALQDGSNRVDLYDEISSDKLVLNVGTVFDCRTKILSTPNENGISKGWRFNEGVFRISEVAICDLLAIAEQSLTEALSRANLVSKLAPWQARLMPGAAELATRLKEWHSQCTLRSISEDAANKSSQRLGGRVTYFDRLDNPWIQLSSGLLKGAIDMAILTEQAQSGADVVRRILPRSFQQTISKEEMAEIEQYYITVSEQLSQIDCLSLAR